MAATATAATETDTPLRGGTIPGEHTGEGPRGSGPPRLGTPRLELRPARPVDVPALVAVFASNPRFVRETWALHGLFDAAGAARYLAAEAGRQNGVCLSIVERASGRVVGTAALLVPNPSDGRPWIGLLVLRADRQRMGLGREAATAIERWLARAGWADVRLAVRITDPGARRFWERVGYREVPAAARLYDGRERATVTLGKPLLRARSAPGAVKCPAARPPGPCRGPRPGSSPRDAQAPAASTIGLPGNVESATGRSPRR